MDPDPELGKFKAGSGSGINHSVSTTLAIRLLYTVQKKMITFIPFPDEQLHITKNVSA